MQNCLPDNRVYGFEPEMFYPQCAQYPQYPECKFHTDRIAIKAILKKKNSKKVEEKSSAKVFIIRGINLEIICNFIYNDGFVGVFWNQAYDSNNVKFKVYPDTNLKSFLADLKEHGYNDFICESEEGTLFY